MTPRVDEVCYRDAYARSLEARVLEVSTADGPPLVVLDGSLRSTRAAAASPRIGA